MKLTCLSMHTECKLLEETSFILYPLHHFHLATCSDHCSHLREGIELLNKKTNRQIDWLKKVPWSLLFFLWKVQFFCSRLKMISKLCYKSYSVFYHVWFISVVWTQFHAFFHLCQFLWAKRVFCFYLWRWPIESNATLSLFYIVQLAIASWEFTELYCRSYIALWLRPWLLPHDITNTKSTCSHYLSLQKTGQTPQHSCFWGKGKPGVFCCTKAKLICSLGGLLMQLAPGD